MSRRPPHFKVFTSVMNHKKLQDVWSDNRLFALWCRLGVVATERFADRTGDQFIVSDRELPMLTGVGRLDVARTSLERLADVSPMSAEREGDVWRITFPNFSKKQGFKDRNGVLTVPPATSSASSSAKKKNTAPMVPCTPEGLASLDDPFIADLVEICPHKTSVPAMRQWLEDRLPHMRRLRKRSLKATARNWAARARKDEILAAAEKIMALEAAQEPEPPMLDLPGEQLLVPLTDEDMECDIYSRE